MDTSERETLTRRRLLRAGAGAATAGAVTAASAGTASAQADVYGGHLEGTSNFEGTADATGFDEVPLEVGVGQQGLLFGPTAAVLVEPGTTVVWEWTGQGGGHNVVHSPDGDADGAFRSGDPNSEAGNTFEYTFEEEGTFKYICVPHETVGMKGVIAVGEDNAEGELFDINFDVGQFDMTPVWGGAAAFGFTSLIGLAAYRNLVGDE